MENITSWLINASEDFQFIHRACIFDLPACRKLPNDSDHLGGSRRIRPDHSYGIPVYRNLYGRCGDVFEYIDNCCPDAESRII